MKDYEIVVGLEVHAELNTKSKIYCNCRNAFGLEVNSQVCPVCMGMPGTLPTLNEKVVEYAIKMGHAMHCQINGVCKQDRKNYFYPDLPKAYQISQAEVPLCGKGYLDVMVDGEMKNVNSFSAAVRGIEYEAKRQIEILEAGGTIAQETRRWDDVKGMSIVMRSKEDAQDYRYFPEPDLLTIVVPEEKIQALKESIPELPNVKLQRYVFDFGLSQTDATLIAEDVSRSTLFDACVAIGTCKPKSISNWILSDIAKYTNETGKRIEETALTPEHLTALVEQVEKGVISNASAKKVFAVIVEENKDPVAVIEEKGMKQNSDTGFLEQLAKDVLAQNEKSVNDYKNGKTNALGYLVGQCMKASKGKANPGIVKEIVTRMLNEG